MKFIQQQEDGVKIEMELPEEATIEKILTAFESFLKACGYNVPGELDFIDLDKPE